MKKFSCLLRAPALSCVSLLFTLHASLFTFNSCAQGVTKYGEITSTGANYIGKNGGIGGSTGVDKNGKLVAASITYGTVRTSLSGASKLWITQNLGATVQATSATDNTAAAAGLYYQFNRQQAYKDGPSPAWTITGINESSDWLAANDPCTIELGAGWRIPTQTEWTNADGNWASYTDTYNSVLKLHAAGNLNNTNGALTIRGAYGYYWSSTQASSTLGWYLYFGSGSSYMGGNKKAYGCSLRCLKD